MSKTCYVLEGGSMRANFTAGVLDYFLIHGVPYPDCIVAVSAGTLAAISYISNQIGRAVRINTTFANDWRYCSMRSYALTGNALGKDYLGDKIQHTLDPCDYEACKRCPSDFYAVCTNVETGKPEYLLVEDMDRDFDCIRASASMPLMSAFVNIDGRKYLDGGTADSIPIRWAIDQGYDKIIVVLTQDRTYSKQQEKALALMKNKYAEYPAYVEAASVRHNDYNRARRKCFKMDKDGQAIVLMPKEPVTVKHMEHDTGKIVGIYNEGLQVAEENFDRIKEYLDI